MHAPYILSGDDLDDFSGIYRKPSILAADDFLGARYRKAMNPKKLWTLLFLQEVGQGSLEHPQLPCFRTRRIGANPEKSDLVNFRGPD